MIVRDIREWVKERVNMEVTWSQNVIVYSMLMGSRGRERIAEEGRVRFVLECTKITTSGSRSDI